MVLGFLLRYAVRVIMKWISQTEIDRADRQLKYPLELFGDAFF